LLATQFLLGCQRVDPDEALAPKGAEVTVPADLERPASLVGKWQEAKGKQTISLREDGKCEIVSKVSLGASVTKGKAQAFDQKTDAKWGVKGEDFYFVEMKDSPALSYHWKLELGKLKLNNNGSVLSYSKI